MNIIVQKVVKRKIIREILVAKRKEGKITEEVCETDLFKKGNTVSIFCVEVINRWRDKFFCEFKGFY